MKTKWFKAKKYGWGWYPSSWQGWAILAAYLLIVWASYELFGSILAVHIEVFLLTILLLVICYKTGEKPRWRWGN